MSEPEDRPPTGPNDPNEPTDPGGPDNPPDDALSLPDSLLTLESVEQAIDVYLSAGLRPILTHAPIEGGTCSCGQDHAKTASGSSSTGKHPIARNWQSHEYTRDELLDQRARLKFTPNVGMVLGKQPAGPYLVSIDVDDEERFRAIVAELGPLPETPRCDSGRGYRLFFEIPHSIDKDRLVNVTGMGGIPGVDVKCKGGQVVVAPAVHASGRRYAWTKAGPIAKLPIPWALELLRDPEIPDFIEKYTPQTLQKDKRDRTRAERYLEAAVLGTARAIASCGEGMRNNTLFSSACRMFEFCAGMYLGHKWQWVHDELLRAAKASGLLETEVRRTLASADKRVRESGKVRFPVVLQQPEQAKPPPPPNSSGDVPDPSTGITGSTVAPAPPDDPWQLAPHSVRPIIQISTELYADVDASIAALRADDNLYQRENKLVYVARISREESEASDIVRSDDEEVHRQLIEDTPHICEMEIPTVRERLSKVAVFQKWNSKSSKYFPIIPTDEIVSAVHKRKQWNAIRSLVGVVETPTLRPDGTIVQTTGYDPVTRYVYLPSSHFPDVTDDKATQDNARWAFGFLSEVFTDFPYVNRAHRSVPIAVILTLIARPAILGSVPAFLFDASTRGSGKTLQTDAIAMIATGRGAPRMNYTSDEIELEKILGGYALNGSPFICLDNVPTMRPFGGGPLDRCITARDNVDLRILGKTRVLTLPWRAAVMATGNNMSLYGDTARRVLMARLEPTEENPERRTKFVHSDLLAWIRTQRPRLVSAALLILRAYFRAGCPNMGCDRWGSFEEWSRLVPQAIVFAGGEDPMKSRPECDEEVDHESRAIRCFITRLHDLVGDDPFRVSAVIDLLYKSERPRNVHGDVCDGFDDLREAIETIVGRRGTKYEGKINIPDSVELGKRLAAFRGRIIAGLRMSSRTGGGGTLRWMISKVAKSDEFSMS